MAKDIRQKMVSGDDFGLDAPTAAMLKRLR
jgi:hypothetical protein